MPPSTTLATRRPQAALSRHQALLTAWKPQVGHGKPTWKTTPVADAHVTITMILSTRTSTTTIHSCTMTESMEARQDAPE